MENWEPSLSLSEACVAAVHRIADSDSAALESAVRLLCSKMPTRRLGDGPPNGLPVCQDGTPIDLSIRVGEGSPDIRCYVDVDPETGGMNLPDQLKRWEAGLSIAQLLGEKYGAYLENFQKAAEMLAPRVGDASLEIIPYRIGFAAAIVKGAPKFQAYFLANDDKILEVLSTFGASAFADQLRAVRGQATIAFALDLVPGAEARTKAYVFLDSFEPSVMSQFRALSEDCWPDVAPYFRGLYGETPKSAFGKGPHLCFHLKSGKVSATTAYLPCMPWWYALEGGRSQTDGDMYRNISSMLEANGVSSSQYKRAVEAFAIADIEDEVYIHRFFSVMRDVSKRNTFTIYLCPRLFAHEFGLITHTLM
jgi:hypothetical protein